MAHGPHASHRSLFLARTNNPPCTIPHKIMSIRPAEASNKRGSSSNVKEVAVTSSTSSAGE